MTHQFDKHYWEDHWAPETAREARSMPVNPYLAAETATLRVGTALDAGCGTGTEARWLAEQGWHVTGADISAQALATAAEHTAAAGFGDQVEWIETDLARWEPGRTWDLVVTNYAHPETGQLTFYQRIASWVAPGGTILIVGHRHGSGHSHNHEHGGSHPEGATATLADITRLFPTPQWGIDTSYENTRTVHTGHRSRRLDDVIFRAHRRSGEAI